MQQRTQGTLRRDEGVLLNGHIQRTQQLGNVTRFSDGRIQQTQQLGNITRFSDVIRC